MFGRKKNEEEVSGTTAEATKTFKESLEKFDEALSIIEMQFKGKRYRRNREQNQNQNQNENQNQNTEEPGVEETLQNSGGATENVESNVETETSTDSTNLRTHDHPHLDPDLKPAPGTDFLPTNKTVNDPVYDSAGNEVKIGDVVGGDGPASAAAAESLSEPTSDLSGQGGPSLVLKPESVKFIKGNRGALGPQGDPGGKTTVMAPSAEPEAPEAMKPEPEGLMRGLAGLGDFLTFGMTDFDGRGDLFKVRGKGQLNTGIDGTTEIPKLDINPDERTLDALGKITDGISQPARGGKGAKNPTPLPVSIPIPVGGGNKQPMDYKMSRMANEVPILPSVDPSNMHVTTTKSLFNIIGAV